MLSGNLLRLVDDCLLILEYQCLSAAIGTIDDQILVPSHNTRKKKPLNPHRFEFSGQLYADPEKISKCELPRKGSFQIGAQETGLAILTSGRSTYRLGGSTSGRRRNGFLTKIERGLQRFAPFQGRRGLGGWFRCAFEG